MEWEAIMEALSTAIEDFSIAGIGVIFWYILSDVGER